MTENIIQRKSYDFALEIVTLCRDLIHEKREYVLGKQLLRSGTSIGANVEEALGAQSKKDFIGKISIAYKEARETSYWIRIMKDTLIIDEKSAMNLLNECMELRKILAKIQKTSSIISNL